MDVDTRTISLFDPIELAGPSMDELIARASAAILSLFEQHFPVVIGFSAGKDSSTVANIALLQAKRANALGFNPLIIVMNGDTRVENPEIRDLCAKELSKMKSFGKKHGFKVITEIVEPSLLTTFQAKVLSGRGIPSFPGSQSDCAQDLKVNSQRSARRKLIKELQQKGLREPVTLIGTRFDESEHRALKMKLRGERPDVPMRNKSDELVLSPIAFWKTEDVFEYLGMAASSLIETYSDMSDVLRIYAHSGGTSCAVVSNDILEGGNKKRKGNCGARTGCWSCQMVDDRSLKTLVDYDEQYAYAKPLVKLSELIRRTRYDWNRRHWIGRTIKKGYVALEPDTYHPSFIRDLTRYMLQIDFDERNRASMAGERRKFEVLPLDLKVAIDFLQNLNGLAPPFQLWADVRDIEQRSIRYDVPDVEAFKPQAMPEPRFLHVGQEWDTEIGMHIGGLRDPYLESLTELSPCLPPLRELPSGHIVWDIDTAKGFSVDLEYAAFIEDEFQSEILDMHDRWQTHPTGLTGGFKWYIGLGTPSLDHSHVRMYDEVARRTEWKHRHGITIDYDINAVYSRGVRFAEMSDEGRAAWSHKATNGGSQMDFDDLVDDVEEDFAALVLSP